MSGSDWSENFEKLLRTYLPLLGTDVVLTPDLRLADLGLDSLATVGLLVDVEESFGVQFSDEALTVDTFATVASLWSVVAHLIREGAEE